MVDGGTVDVETVGQTTQTPDDIWWVQNLVSALSSREGMAGSFQADTLLSGFGLPQAKVMLDIALENQKPEGFTACELGVGSGGLTKQVPPPSLFTPFLAAPPKLH